MLIASTKCQSSRVASHQLASMSCHLTIGDTCLPCLFSQRRLLYWRCLFVVGREVSWEGGKGVWLERSDKAGKVCEWSEVTSWEGWENNEVVQWERWEHNKGVVIGERWEGSEQRRWDGIYRQNCVVLLQGSEMYVGIHCRDLNNSYLMFWVITMKWITVA